MLLGARKSKNFIVNMEWWGCMWMCVCVGSEQREVSVYRKYKDVCWGMNVVWMLEEYYLKASLKNLFTCYSS